MIKTTRHPIEFIRTLFIASVFGVATTQAERIDLVRINSNGDFARAEQYVRNSKADTVRVVITEGEYTLSDSFRIQRSRVTLIGEGKVVLRLADGSNCPVIVVGSQKDYVEPADYIESVAVRSVEIDGNRLAQTSEFDRSRPWIRNNGIDVRGVSGLVVDNLVARNCRSGGLVISWGCSDALVYRSRFEGNHFDGLAYYDSQRIFTVDCDASGNLCAGVSIDNRFSDSVFARCRIENNGDVGVFARNSARLFFVECQVARSRQWAFFLAHDEQGQGISESAIVDCQIVENNGGVRMASTTETQSRDNALSGNRFSSNGIGGRGDVDTAGSPLQQLDAFEIASRIQGLDSDAFAAAFGADSATPSTL